ncbi:ShlB/FhaC/HecB family hemolysin secretion/activation protein [Edwardsiella hoshinae]|uniref:Hemolysin transporter protein shlB n=1 Tax=Edwardsiella hoshinae TaxID=93378 RepID=A0A376DJF5_9GAMM|nr:ShlB/FhaC/HecB family hemolysin secretion/activation protein [Edwardsiella hoshinae]QPR29462.1 ShlB/FhaC/HecB family hemolysin secretion/activation protein [Edwardsiella hoshinae]STC90412.1 Hemolysin transporter protein shlB precursor [Edwardsiella hoshinae]
MSKAFICRLLGMTLWGVTSSVGASSHWDLTPTDESRRALQNSTREWNTLLEQQALQRLAKPKQTAPPAFAADQLRDVDACLPISGVYLTGISLLSLRDLAALDALPMQCIRSRDVNRLAKQLTALYLDKGYITARVQFLRPNARGELGVRVTEGYIERIEGGDWGVNRRWLFPGLSGKPLRLRDLDQGLDQANRLRSNHVSMDILPGEHIGGSVIRLYNRRTRPWQVNVSLDNAGQQGTGEWLAHGSATLDSPLGLSDFASLSVSSTLAQPATRYSRSYLLFYSLPYGALTFSGFASFSHYLLYQPLLHTRIRLDGHSSQYGLRVDRVMQRSQRQINTLGVQLSAKRIRNYLQDDLLQVSSPTLSVAEFGINHLHVLPNGVATANLSLERGLRLLGADRGRLRTGAEAQYTKLKLAASWTQRFALCAADYRFTSQWYGQYSRDALPGVEWISLTERSAVRGFKRGTLSADNGWYWQNTLSRPLTWRALTLTPRIGVDVGRVRANTGHQGWQSGVGAVAGVTLAVTSAQLDIEVGRARALSNNYFPGQSTQLLTQFSYSF